MNEKNTKTEKPYGFWNWGTGITIAIIVAASLMIFLVYKSVNVTFDMAEPDYYAAELKFDEKMNAIKNGNSLSTPVTIEESEDLLAINFPKECVEKKIEGSLLLYRPSSQDKDLQLPLTPDSNGYIFLQKSKLINGKYRLKADWIMDGKNYRVEQDFFVSIP